jgi:hypothetical protein
MAARPKAHRFLRSPFSLICGRTIAQTQDYLRRMDKAGFMGLTPTPGAETPGGANRKETRMKLIAFVSALALAGAVGGCGDDGGSGTGGTGGGGTGGGGGAVTDACTNAADTAVYDGVTYTNLEGDFEGTKAVSEIAADCVFGNSMGEAPNLISDGCPTLVGPILIDPNEENVTNMANCVVDCTVEQGVDLSQQCLDCYGDTVACGAAFCATPCSEGTDTEGCLVCRCGGGLSTSGVNCVVDFDTCSGLEPNTTCP